ncbi:MAG: hypothetical protein V4584_07695 [Verrucomicrobiota bacterium]
MKFVKDLVKRLSPDLFQQLASIRFFLYCRRTFGPCQQLIAREVFHDGPIKVLGGPFEGMAYYNKTIWGTITGKWLGCYEQEIQPVIAEMIAEQYPTVIDIGAAEGYYAVGLALKMPRSQVISYDTDPIARFRQRQLAELNGISNLEVRKYCSAAELGTFKDAKAVVICDIEGFEYTLMNPAKSPALRNLDILIEIHRTEEHQVSEGAELLEKRFAATHSITRYHAVDRDREEMRSRVPELKNLTDAQTNFALDEGRYPGQIWLWMKARLR